MKPQTQDERRHRTRKKLIEATIDEIVSAGMFSADRVASRAGTATATFYSHFPSKDAALEAAFSQVLDECLLSVEDGLSIERLLDEGLARVCDHLVASAISFLTQRSAVFHRALAEASKNPDLRQLYREHEGEAHARYRRFLELGQAAKLIRLGDLDILATMMLVYIRGLSDSLLRGRETGDPLLNEFAQMLERHLSPESGRLDGNQSASQDA